MPMIQNVFKWLFLINSAWPHPNLLSFYPLLFQNVKKWAIGLSFTYHCVSSGVLPTYTINWINYSGNDQILDSLDGRRIIRYRTPAAVPLHFRCTSLGVCYQSLIKILSKVTICSPLFLPGIYWSYSKSNSSVSLFWDQPLVRVHWRLGQTIIHIWTKF